MALAPDSLFDIAKVFAARTATVGARRRHQANFPFEAIPHVSEVAPPTLQPPVPMDADHNGYLHALRVSEAMPDESPTECNAIHRALALMGSHCPNEMAASCAAVGQYEPHLQDLIKVLDTFPVWQVPNPEEDGDLPELTNFKRLGQALLLRGAVRTCAGDEAAAEADFRYALDLSNRLRSCDGFLLHLLVGIAIEVVAHKILRQMVRRPETRPLALACLRSATLDGRKAELVEVYRSEFSRLCIPRALYYVRPWKSAPPGSPASFEFPNLAAQWILANHPCPYNPIETAIELASIGEMLLAWIEEGWSVAPALEEMRQNYAQGWPEGVAVSPISQPRISIRALVGSRKALMSVENPFGKLACAKTLHSSSEVYRAALMGQLRVGSTLVLAASTQLGHKPSCLEELVGNGLLHEIPTDPFTDAPLEYESRDGAVWSPGPLGQTYAEARRCGATRYDSPFWLKL